MSPSIFLSELQQIIYLALTNLYDESCEYQNRWSKYKYQFLTSSPLIDGQPPPPTTLADNLNIEYAYSQTAVESRLNLYYDISKLTQKTSSTNQNPTEVYTLTIRFVDNGKATDGLIDTTDHTPDLFDILSTNLNGGLTVESLYKAQKTLLDSQINENFYDFHHFDKSRMQPTKSRQNQSYILDTRMFIDISTNQILTYTL
jgi:hypothetical protein